MTFPAKQWTDAQLYDLAEKCARKLRATDKKLVHATVHLLFGPFTSDTLRVLGSDGAPHGTVSGFKDWGCRCDPCEDVWEREQARLDRTERKSA